MSSGVVPPGGLAGSALLRQLRLQRLEQRAEAWVRPWDAAVPKLADESGEQAVGLLAVMLSGGDLTSAWLSLARNRVRLTTMLKQPC